MSVPGLSFRVSSVMYLNSIMTKIPLCKFEMSGMSLLLHIHIHVYQLLLG
jgi:hypothetical protein